MAAEKGGRFLDDKQSLDAIVAAMPPRPREAYDALGALTLEAGFPNRVMVVYRLECGQPVDIKRLTLGDLEVTRVGGPTVSTTDSKGHVLVVGVTPVQIREDLFIHVPQNFVFRWKGKQTDDKGVQYVPHYAILIKTRSREHLQVDGDTYCVTLNKFRERFPEVPVRY